MKPYLSVVLCSYQGERFVAAQLDSIGAQTRIPDELVVVDDASTDATVAVVECFAQRGPMAVHVAVNEHNVGFAQNFAGALARASGEILVLSDQDDVWHPERLARLEDALRRAPEASVVFSDAELVAADLRPLRRRLWETIGFGTAARASVRDGEALPLLVRRTVVTGATMAFRASLRELALPIPVGVDHDAWIALLGAALGPLAMVEEPLLLYRQHENNQIGARELGLRQRIVRARRDPTGGIAARLWLNQCALERLTGHVSDTRLRPLRDSVTHLSARLGILRSRRGRLGRVVSELAMGRYARYSESLGSAVRDLIV